MKFYNLTQSGTEVQRLLDSMEVLDIDIDAIEKRIDDIPVINIDTDKPFDISSNINNTGIYCIKSININKSTIKPDKLPINSEYSFIIHLQSYDQNNLNHSSQYLITQDDNRNIVVYKRNTENEDSWTEFVDTNKEIVDYIEKRIDQSYSETDTPKSTNAQSGKAVAEAIANKSTLYTGTEYSNSDPHKLGGSFSVSAALPYKNGDFYYNTDEHILYAFTSVISSTVAMSTSFVLDL